LAQVLNTATLTGTHKIDAFAQVLIAYLKRGGDPVPLWTIRDNAIRVFDSRNYFVLDRLDDEYVDLYHLAQLVNTSNITDTAVKAAAPNVMNAVSQAVIAEHHQSGTRGASVLNLDNAHGISIYFPPNSSGWDPAGYVRSPSLWALGRETSWDDLSRMLLGPPSLAMGYPGVPPMPPVSKVYLPVVLR
jgi:hypothetical protein